MIVISQLIKSLEEAKAAHGDIQVLGTGKSYDIHIPRDTFKEIGGVVVDAGGEIGKFLLLKFEKR